MEKLADHFKDLLEASWPSWLPPPTANSSLELHETSQGFMKRKLHRVLKMLVGRLPSLLKSVACLSIGLLTARTIALTH